MQAITQSADDGRYVITRGCSQMSRVPQKVNNIVEFFPYGCGLRTPNVRGAGGMLNADTCGMRTRGDGVKNWQNLADVLSLDNDLHNPKDEFHCDEESFFILSYNVNHYSISYLYCR